MCDVLSTTIVTQTDSIVGQSEVTRGINGFFFYENSNTAFVVEMAVSYNAV